MERANLVDEVMSWEVEVITVKESLKEAGISMSKDVANAVDDTFAKFKGSKEFATLFKKDHDTRFDIRVDAIFYNIWMHYQGLDYAFFGSKLTDLIGEWLEEKRLTAPEVTPPFVPLDPLTRHSTEIEISSAETSEQLSVVEVVEVTVTLDLSIAPKVPVAKLNSSVAAVQPLINLEEELIATDVEEEPEATANCFTA